eukprot:1420632-Heterocapsa_arctica.AAC.1
MPTLSRHLRSRGRLVRTPPTWAYASLSGLFARTWPQLPEHLLAPAGKTRPHRNCVAQTDALLILVIAAPAG